MKFKALIVFGLMAVATAIAAPANAATYLWTYTDNSASVIGSGYLSTDAADYVNGEVTSITGAVFGDTITGLVPNPSAPATAVSGDGLWFYDNNLTFPSPLLTNSGLLFTVASATVDGYNLYSSGAPGGYELYGYQGSNYGADTAGTFSVTAVPEPGVWAMLLLGFGLIGFMLRTTRRSFKSLLTA